MSYFNEIAIKSADSPSIDAFGRLRMSNPLTIFDSKMVVDNLPLFWDDAETSGSGTSSAYNGNQASVTLGVSNTTAGIRVRQTKRRFNYQPGKSQLIFLTFAIGSGGIGITKRIGYYDDNDGIFLEQNNTTINLVIRTNTSGSPVDSTKVSQSNWNIDTMDGLGPSGVTLDINKTQILIIDFEWLGVGRIRIGFIINGMINYVHQFLNSNNLSLVYMSVPNLPARYEISNDGTGAANDLTQICSSVISEGGLDLLGSQRSIDRGVSALTTLNDSNLYPLVSIRLKSTHLCISVFIEHFNVLCSTGSDFRFCLILNPTVVGTALNFTGLLNSAIEYDVTSTNATTVTGGTQIFSSYAADTNKSSSIISNSVNILTLGAKIDGTRDVLVLCAQRIGSQSEDFFGTIIWKEIL